MTRTHLNKSIKKKSKPNICTFQKEVKNEIKGAMGNNQILISVRRNGDQQQSPYLTKERVQELWEQV